MPCSSEGENVVRDSKCFPCLISVNIKYEIYAFFGSDIYARMYNKHGLMLTPPARLKKRGGKDKHVVSGLWVMKPNKSDFMKPIHFIVEHFFYKIEKRLTRAEELLNLNTFPKRCEAN